MRTCSSDDNLLELVALLLLLAVTIIAFQTVSRMFGDILDEIFDFAATAVSDWRFAVLGDPEESWETAIQDVRMTRF